MSGSGLAPRPASIHWHGTLAALRFARAACSVIHIVCGHCRSAKASMAKLTHQEWSKVVIVAGIGTILEWVSAAEECCEPAAEWE